MEKQPHALTDTPVTEMRRENATRELAPSTSDAERKVPDARRHVDQRVIRMPSSTDTTRQVRLHGREVSELVRTMKALARGME